MKFRLSLKIPLNVLLLFAVIFQSIAYGQLTVPHFFSSDMVLQRNQPINIWGQASPAETIVVHLGKETQTTQSDEIGKWHVSFPKRKASTKSIALVIESESEKLEYKNILIGDVWLCSGQSNMEYKMQSFPQLEQEIADAGNPMLRLITIPRDLAFRPKTTVLPTRWQVTTPETVASFSAVAYFFGKKMQEETGVPTGLLVSTWGGTMIEGWIPVEALQKLPDYTKEVALFDSDQAIDQIIERRETRRKELKASLRTVDPGLTDGVAHWAQPSYDHGTWEDMELPGHWERKGFDELDGVVWFEKDILLEKGETQAMAHLGPIDDSDITYWNGVEIGRTIDQWDAIREYAVPDSLLREGINKLVVRVEDTRSTGGMWANPEHFYIDTDQGKISLQGIWKYEIGKGKISKRVYPNNFPTRLYNAMIHPLKGLKFSGVIWYQGESNARNAFQYRTTFPTLIQAWREQLSNATLPFYYVQLANFREHSKEPVQSQWAELREAQLQTLIVKHTGMASAIDLGQADDVHPWRKQEVGERLARWALHGVYGKQKIVTSGPLYRNHTFEGGACFIDFNYKADGLKVKGDELQGFTIAGADQVFYNAQAQLADGQVKVWNDKVKDPAAVRYAWQDNPANANLYNSADLPASPFRTDAWPGITVSKKYKTQLQ